MDRISNLPENLISHILSFLPTKDVFRTSTLSTHWKQQWKSITRLDFDDNDFLVPSRRTSITRTMFVNFIDRILPFLEVTRLELFRLKCHDHCDELHANAWVSTALSRYVQQLDISMPMLWQNFPPCSLFTSRTLVVLKFGRDFILQVPTTVSLESLKILHLESVHFEDDDSLSRLISSCLMLEDLKIQGFIGQYIEVIGISSLRLKRLALIGISLSFQDYIYNHKVVLNTPNLQCLEYEDYLMAQRYSIESLHNLVRARICLGDLRQTYNEYKTNDEYENTKKDLFVGISNVQFLYLSIDWDDEVPYDSICQLPKFPHLTYLKIKGGVSLTDFLESSPHLQTLVIEGELRYYNEWIDFICPPPSVPSCMVFHLKLIEINTFRGSKEDMHAVRYFLNNSEVLEELRINYLSPGKQEELEICKELFDLPRVSRSCKIVLM